MVFHETCKRRERQQKDEAVVFIGVTSDLGISYGQKKQAKKNHASYDEEADVGTVNKKIFNY